MKLTDENYSEILNEMRELTKNEKLQALTINAAKDLKGKRIRTFYFGYWGQDGLDEFVVGEVKPEIYHGGKEGPLCLFTEGGRNTYIRAHKENEGFMTCSDSDRFVVYMEI